MDAEAIHHEFDEIREGQEIGHPYVITREAYDHFLDAFSDRNPIHVDETYARSKGFPSSVMHGAILNGFLSHFVGMIFPGKNSMILSTELRFLKPSFLGDELRCIAQVEQISTSQKVIVMKVRFFNQTQKIAVAKGSAQVKYL